MEESILPVGHLQTAMPSKMSGNVEKAVTDFSHVTTVQYTAVQALKIFCHVLVLLANNPTLGVQHAVAAGYKNNVF